jgi:glucosylceramidase
MNQIRGSAKARRTLSAVVLLFVAVGIPFAAGQKAQSVRVYQSSQGGAESLVEKEPLKFTAAKPEGIVVSVDDSQTFQEIEGFGASLTDSSAWLFSQKLSAVQRKDWMTRLFGPKKGIGLSILRQPMGSSDFAREDYSYDDMPAGQSDPELKDMTIERDRAYVIPVLREALAANPGIKIIGSPWSPPGWMKTSDSMIGGTLKPSAYAPLAHYFVEFVKQYEASGVPIFAVTPENEPLNIPRDYPGMGMSAEEQARFVGEYLGPAFRDAQLKTKILIFDHNWDLMDFPAKILSDPEASKFAFGTATHCYGGSPDAQTKLHEQFPTKGIWLTECSGGNWQKGDLLVSQVGLIIQTLRNWGKSVVLWNLALDQNHSPHLGGCKDCRGIVTIDTSTTPATVTPTVDFTAFSQVSKFLEPGAVRISSGDDQQPGLEHVAFRNRNGSIVLLALNSGTSPTPFNIEWKGSYAAYTLAAGAAATFLWAGETARRN